MSHFADPIAVLHLTLISAVAVGLLLTSGRRRTQAETLGRASAASKQDS